MKTRNFCLAALLLCLTQGNVTMAQTSGITSGAIYTLTSKANNKQLDVSNSSVNNGAPVYSWADTHSDAQRWVVKLAGKNLYTLTNVGSGKLLHVGETPADSAKVDQNEDTNGNDVKWTIKKISSGVYSLQPAGDAAYALNLHASGAANGTKVNLAKTAKAPAQQWVFKKVEAQQSPLTLPVATKVFDDWYNTFKLEERKGFWDQAEMMEVVLDAYEVTKDPKYKTKFDALYTNFIAKNKADWMYNNYNDDISWAVLFCIRGYNMFGNKAYLEKAKDQYDKMFARAFTNTYGGGLIWYETKTSKNACIEGPAMVAACYLAQATGDKTYYDKAIALYSWSKIYLFNPATGKVNDNIDLNKTTGKLRGSDWSSTYNQGTYLGAAVMLYNYTKEYTYLEEAERIAKYARDVMYKGGVMNNEEGGNDLPGFKGIFARYARMYTKETRKTDLVEWLQLNAKVAYNNRNEQGIIQTNWGTRTGETKPRGAFGASTAVSLLFNTYGMTN